MAAIALALALPVVGARAAPPNTSTVHVAAAADLKFALEEVIAVYRKTAPAIEVRPTFGSSGSFFAQISNGLPADVFLSADAKYPRKLIEVGAAVAGSEFVYAIGRIVLWVPRGSPIDLDKLGMKALLDPTVRKIAIANPDHAPYGVAAVEAMRAAGLYEQVEAKLVRGQNIAQAAQFVQTGNVEIGVLAISLALSPTMTNEGRWWLVPQTTYGRMEQAGVLLRSSTNPDAARAFIAFLQGPEARAIMEKYGFVLPR